MKLAEWEKVKLFRWKGGIVFVWAERTTRRDVCVQVLGTGKQCCPKAIQPCLSHHQ